MNENERNLSPEDELIEPGIEIASIGILFEKIDKLREEKFDAAMAILLSGDRISCCDEGVIMSDKDKTIGLATIAPEGEERSGQPTIVGLYVAPKYRKKGYGAKILQRAVERCLERGLDKKGKIRMEVMSSWAKKIIDKFPDNLKEKIEVYDLGSMMDDF